MKNQFEQHIKKSLEGFEAEYNPADWSDLQSKLSKAKAGKASGLGKGLMIAASVIATSGVIYYFSITDTAKNTATTNSVAEVKNGITKDIHENPVQNIEIKDEQQKPAQPLAKNDNAEKASVIHKSSEEKKIVSEKPETQAVDNTENQTSIPEQVQNPVEQSQTSNAVILSAGFRTDINKVCEGAEVQFIADKNDISCTYKWYFGDGESSIEQNPKHIFAEAGTYSVKLRVTSARDKKQAEQKNTIHVIAAPSVQMNYASSEDNKLLVNFEADADKVTDWKWDFGDKQTSSVQNPSHKYSKRGSYKVAVTAKNSAGCLAVVVKDIILKNEINLLAPNAFSPDGNGVNDTWMPVALLNGDYIFTLTIADKAGNIVHKTSDKNNSWDGKNAKAGDTFVWRVAVKDNNGEETLYQGLITISE